MQPPSAERLWTAAQQLLRTILDADIYNLWFAPLKATGVASDEITLEVANDFCEVWLKDNYLGLIRDVLATAAGQEMKVRFAVATGRPEATLNANAESARESQSESDAPEKTAAPKEHGFNPKNTFDTFVVGSNNTFAHAAAMAV